MAAEAADAESGWYCRLTRREAVRLLAAGALAPRITFNYRGLARLAARPRTDRPSTTVSSGLTPLGLDSPRDGLLLVPRSYTPERPAPFLLALHGATGNAQRPIDMLRDEAERRGFILLAVDSRDGTWDAVQSAFGPDVAFIDRALQWAFDRLVVDPERIGVEGFSDGASYSLGLGLPNGDLFRKAMAFSPGMVPASETPDHGKVRIFLSHGTQDPVLNIDRTSRVLARGLAGDGFDVTFVEFDGVHTVPPAILTRAMDWWLGEEGRGKKEE